MSDPPPGSGRAGGGRPCPLVAEEVEKRFTLGDGSELRVLAGVDLEVREGEAVAIVGQSGAGKSTLLHVLGGLDRPTAGSVRIGGVELANLGSNHIAEVRNRQVGFVFQFHHLLREFSAVENVMVPTLIGGRPRSEASARARELLGAVGLGEREDHKPWQLSGGEQQRVAVARALANEPTVLLADEPSGNLDRKKSEELHDLLFRLREDRGLTLVLVTHNLELAGRADRTLELADGVLHTSGRG